MKRSRFSEEQIIHWPAGYCAAMSREGDIEGTSGWAWCEGAMPQAWCQRCDVLQMAFEVWRDALHGRLSRSDVPRVEVSDAKKSKAIEVENAKLKEMLGTNF